MTGGVLCGLSGDRPFLLVSLRQSSKVEGVVIRKRSPGTHLLCQPPAHVRLVHFAGSFRASGAPGKRLQSDATCKFTASGERLL